MLKSEEYKNKTWLQGKYIGQEKICIEIANICGCHRTTIQRQLKKFAIPVRSIAEYKLGTSHSDETKRKMSEAHKGKRNSEEARRKLSESRKGMKFSEEHIKNLSLSHKGQTLSIEHRKKISEALRGEKAPNWKGGKSFEPYCPAFNNEIKEKIRNRDNRVCVLCDKSEILNGRRLSVHHIDGNKMQGCNSDWYLCSLCISCNSEVDTIEKEFLIVSNMKRFK